MQLNQEQLQLLIDLLAAQVQEPEVQPVTVDTVSFEQLVEDRAKQIIKEKTENYQKNLRVYEKINTCFLIALENYISPEMAKLVVNNLDLGRRTNNYSTMMKVYGKIKNLHERNMIKLVSAIYRRYFSNNKKYVYQMNSIINAVTACDHCGDLAKQINNYLAENLI